MDLFRVNIINTYECNKFCEGCYIPRTGDRMDSTLARIAAAWVTKTVEEKIAKRTVVHFFGGETLLNLEPVFVVFDYLLDHCPPFDASSTLLFTNGDFLTRKILGELKKRHIKLLLNPTDSALDVVEQRMEFIEKFCGGVSLSVALTKLNMDRLLDLVRLAIKHNAHIRLSRLYEKSIDPLYIKEYAYRMEEALKLLLLSKTPMWPNFIVDSYYPTWKGDKNPYLCGKSLVVIDPDGTLRSCNPDFHAKLGHLSENPKFSDFKFPQRMSAKRYSECQECEWVVWCQGGCPYSSKVVHGEYGKGKTPFCSAVKRLFPLLMALTQKWEEHERKNNAEN